MESSLPYGVICQERPDGKHIRKAVSKHLLLRYLVLGNELQGGGNRPSSAPIGAGYAGCCIWTSENSSSTSFGE